MSLDTSKLQCVKRNGDGSVTARCPACASAGGDRAGQHLKIWPSGAFNCIVGSEGDITHNRFIRSHLRGIAGETSDHVVVLPERIEVDPIYPEEMLSKLIPDHSYWIKRGVRPDVIAMLGGGVSPADEKSKLSNRYVIPIRGLSGQINGFSGRILTDSTWAPKYKDLFIKKNTCWPWHISGPSIIKSRKVVLQEGWSEWLFLHGSGITNSLSLFGLNLSDIMIGQLLAHDVEKIIISTNDDPGDGKVVNGIVQRKGKLRAQDFREKLLNFWTPENVIIRHPKSDWGEASEEGRQAFRAEVEAL